MTPQEQQMIDGLIDRIRNTQITDRDPEAAAHLQQGLGGNPDAIYILAQTVLVQQQALLQAQNQLQAANAELAKLRDAAGHPPQQSSGSWLDRFFGTNSAPPPNQGYPQQGGYPPAGAQQPPYGAPVYGSAPAQAYATQQYPPQGYGYAQPAGGGFLRNAVQTAAGVAAGAFLFEGVESMFGSHGGYGGGGTTVNNYYEDRPATEHHETGSDGSFYDPSHDASRDLSGSSAASDNGGLSSDIEDRRGFSDSSNDVSSDDSANSDDSSYNDDSSSSDDSSSFDDGGGSSGDDGSF
jgi:hypothetical protein